MTRLILVRHGESTWNSRGCYQGRTDTELSDRGLHQAALLANRLKDTPIHAIYSSPLKRALTTAQEIASLHLLPVQIDPLLIEIDHGEWEGLTKKEVETRFASIHQQWLTSPSQTRFPGGESLDEVCKRAQEALARIAKAPTEQTTLVSSHDAVLKVMVLSALGLGIDSFWSIDLDNASVSVLEYTDGRWRLLLLNDTCHLGELKSDTSLQAL